MEEGLFRMIAILVLAGISMAFTASRTASYRRALAEPVGTETCVACGESDMLESHPDAWTCTSCGYEQGPGWDRMRRERHIERLASMSPEEARAHALRLVADARLSLRSALPALDRPIVWEGDHRNRHPELTSEILEAGQNLTRGFEAIREAASVDPEVGAALRDSGIQTGSVPDFALLYDVETAELGANSLRPHLAAVVDQLASASRTLGLET